MQYTLKECWKKETEKLTYRQSIYSLVKYGVFKPINFNIGHILHCYFNYNKNANKYLYSLVQKGAQNTINITNNTFLSKGLYLPVQEEEQYKISCLLSKMNIKIEKEQEKLEVLNTLKKGLRQQMFI